MNRLCDRDFDYLDFDDSDLEASDRFLRNISNSYTPSDSRFT